MAMFRIIDQIDIGHEGPVANWQNGEHQLIHLAQGSMDGACGPYSLMMALIICGLIDREDLVSLRKVDGRTSAGKLLNALQEYQGFFRDGTHLEDLSELLEKSYPKHLDVVPCIASGIEVRKFVKEHVDNNHPVILSLDYGDDDGHWVLAIGYEYETNNQIYEEYEPIRFLILDPDKSAPVFSAWNGIVDARGTGGRYPYVWWGKDYKVNFTAALALCPK